MAMPLVSWRVSPPFAAHVRLSTSRTKTKAAVFCPRVAITSSESGGIATLALAAIAERRCALSCVSLRRPATYTGVSTSASVRSTAIAVINAIFQRNGNVEKRERRLTWDGLRLGVRNQGEGVGHSPPGIHA